MAWAASLFPELSVWPISLRRFAASLRDSLPARAVDTLNSAWGSCAKKKAYRLNNESTKSTPKKRRAREAYDRQAKERQREAGKTHGRGQGKVVENLPQANDTGKARDQAAKAVGVSGKKRGANRCRSAPNASANSLLYRSIVLRIPPAESQTYTRRANASRAKTRCAFSRISRQTSLRESAATVVSSTVSRITGLSGIFDHPGGRLPL